MATKSTEKVNLIIGTSEAPPSHTEEFKIYKEYIINQNIELQRQIKELELEVRELNSAKDELEEEADQSDKRIRNLKQHVQNFHTVSEIHREINDNCQEFTVKEIANYERDQLRKQYVHKASKSHRNLLINISVFLFYNLILLYLYSAVAVVLNVVVAVVYYMFVYPHLESDQVKIKQLEERLDAQEKDFHDKVKVLVTYRKSRQEELDELARTIDVIGEFLDNAI